MCFVAIRSEQLITELTLKFKTSFLRTILLQSLRNFLLCKNYIGNGLFYYPMLFFVAIFSACPGYYPINETFYLSLTSIIHVIVGVVRCFNGSCVRFDWLFVRPYWPLVRPNWSCIRLNWSCVHFTGRVYPTTGRAYATTGLAYTLLVVRTPQLVVRTLWLVVRTCEWSCAVFSIRENGTSNELTLYSL